mmetsp:Transcript_67541/g.175383  ORF Transcript_67541/g.175383 Transcript_67541/m.175383 type:complete len:82 (-) Transcript_67541:177-422(-)
MSTREEPAGRQQELEFCRFNPTRMLGVVLSQGYISGKKAREQKVVLGVGGRAKRQIQRLAHSSCSPVDRLVRARMASEALQ